MTKARLEYLSNCSMYERRLRDELKHQAKNIKRDKADLSYRLNTIKGNPQITKSKVYMEFLQLAKKSLQMHKAFYMAAKKLLPKRKAAKKKKLELKPCPFCGGKAKAIEFGRSVFLAKCIVCELKFPNVQATREKCIEAWNRRAKQ